MKILVVDDSLLDRKLLIRVLMKSGVTQEIIQAEDGEQANEELYFLFFQDKPQGLNVDMEGYIQLLNMSGGFAYWQESLLFLQGNSEATLDSIEKFKKYMPLIFPDFKWDEFVALYERVKIK